MPAGGRKRKGGKVRGEKIRDAKKRQQMREQHETQSVREDLKVVPDQGWGTSPSSLGEVKRASDEAKLLTCPDCGYSAGRHSRMCPQSKS